MSVDYARELAPIVRVRRQLKVVIEQVNRTQLPREITAKISYGWTDSLDIPSQIFFITQPPMLHVKSGLISVANRKPVKQRSRTHMMLSSLPDAAIGSE